MDTRDEEAIPIIADEQQQEQQQLIQTQPQPQPQEQEQETDQGLDQEQKQQQQQPENQVEVLLVEPIEYQKLEYVKKILNIFIVQLFIYTFLSIFVCSNQSFIQYFKENPEFILLSVILTLISLIVGYYLSNYHTTGWVLLCLFTFFHALMLTNFCTQLMLDEKFDFNAISVTLLFQLLLILVISVRVYTQFAKHEFQIMEGFVSALISAPFIIIFYLLVFQMEIIGQIILLYIPFAIFIVVELYYIQNGKRIELHLDNPIRGALIVHIDILLGFLIVLALILCTKDMIKYCEQREEDRRVRERERERRLF